MKVETMTAAAYRKAMQDNFETPSEHLSQKQLMDWVDTEGIRKHPDLRLLFAIPNGGHRFIAVGKKMKAEGVKAGVPDLFLPVSSGEYHGLFIEMKHGYNKPSEIQLRWLKDLAKQKYLCKVCYSSEEAIDVLIDYIENGE